MLSQPTAAALRRFKGSSLNLNGSSLNLNSNPNVALACGSASRWPARGSSLKPDLGRAESAASIILLRGQEFKVKANQEGHQAGDLDVVIERGVFQEPSNGLNEASIHR